MSDSREAAIREKYDGDEFQNPDVEWLLAELAAAREAAERGRKAMWALNDWLAEEGVTLPDDLTHQAGSALVALQRAAACESEGDRSVVPDSCRELASSINDPARRVPSARTPTRCDDLHPKYGRCALIAGHEGTHSFANRTWR